MALIESDRKTYSVQGRGEVEIAARVTRMVTTEASASLAHDGNYRTCRSAQGSVSQAYLIPEAVELAGSRVSLRVRREGCTELALEVHLADGLDDSVAHDPQGVRNAPFSERQEASFRLVRARVQQRACSR